MPELSTITDKSIKQILTELEGKEEVNASLPGGGFLHIEKEVPYLVVYRQKEYDKGTSRIVSSEASYLLIGNQSFNFYKELLFEITNKLSAVFKTYMLFEIYTGEEGSNTFLIKGPEGKLPSSLQVLKTELEEINKLFSGLYLQSKISNTTHRHPNGA